MRTRIKICGITNEADLAATVDAGADAIGFNLFAGSPRFVETDLAGKLVRQVPAFVTTVGLFVNAEAAHVNDVCSRVPFDLLQFHGDETDEFCREFNRPFMKVIRVGEDTDIEASIAAFPNASAIMLDTMVKGVFGGTGTRFDWGRVPRSGQRMVVAGGLDDQNVAEAIKMVRPFAVDVSSGVEAEKGRKDHGRIRAFAAAVARADEELR